LASAGIGVSIFNILLKIFNIPLLSIATSYVAEDISKNASKHSSSRNWILSDKYLILDFMSRHAIYFGHETGLMISMQANCSYNLYLQL
jgi:hypothetical protein